MNRLGLLLVLVLAGCGVDEATVDAVCRQWCLPGAGSSCGGGHPVDCLDYCVRQSQELCGEHRHAQKVCQLGLDCEDLFHDCGAPDEAYNECRSATIQTCLVCGAAADNSALYDVCLAARGDCPLAHTCAEMCPLDPEACASNSGQCGVTDVCYEMCPLEPDVCASNGGECGVADNCYVQCGEFYNLCVESGGECPQP